ncbi:hypothetical protein BU24DRAFT_370670 [Aaosphaeria arxii CBS 175.79]|uniref:Uncharacterized protein n=1 Tax=Aaosphaeria arxii CBS 175.79 TaxID=1450172 RepID=A0A6A5XTU5_9PLEO|nr:uncharacterized protein BU24DRAFT_370670 [Aaosphaeria arxii CBS 175.79]KAF2016738.1 hypothetical protein BU24DRAFT_370670 [Aaosphaeria arxii CBS 175.79]
MNGREIPGFYFDPEKGKYFKVQNAKDHKYSRGNVAKLQQRHKDEKASVERIQKRRTETVVAAHQHKLLFQLSQREIGDRRKSFYSQDLWAAASVAGYSPTELDVTRFVSHFDRNPGTGDIFVASTDVNVDRSRPIRGNPYGDYMRDHERFIRMTSEISSLNYIRGSGSLVVTTFGSDRPPVIYFTTPEIDGPFIGEQFTPRNCSTVWTSLPRPFMPTSTNTIASADTEAVAVGASRALLIFTRTSQGGTWDCETALNTESDVLALSWLSSTTVCLGGRDGTIRLYDTRSKGTSHTLLRHPTPINQIRPADDFTRIVVAGLRNTLMTYDMRMTKTEQVSKTQWRKRGNNRFPFRTTNSCITQFEYANENTTYLGLDVNPRLGLVAAADEDARLNIYSLYTGKMIKQFSSDFTGPKKRMQCVRFTEDANGDISLLSNWNAGVARFDWNSLS